MLPQLTPGVARLGCDCLAPTQSLGPAPVVVTCSDYVPVDRALAQACGRHEPPTLLRLPGLFLCDGDLETGMAGATLQLALARGASDVVLVAHTGCLPLQIALSPGPGASPAWRRSAARTRYLLAEHHVGLNPRTRLRVGCCENALAQLERLASWSFLREREVPLHLWIHDDATGEVHAYSPQSASFEPLCEVA